MFKIWFSFSMSFTSVFQFHSLVVSQAAFSWAFASLNAIPVNSASDAAQHTEVKLSMVPRPLFLNTSKFDAICPLKVHFHKVTAACVALRCTKASHNHCLIHTPPPSPPRLLSTCLCPLGSARIGKQLIKVEIQMIPALFPQLFDLLTTDKCPSPPG